MEEQLCELKIETNLHISSLDHTEYGESFFREIKNIPKKLETQHISKKIDWMKLLLKEFKKRLWETFLAIINVEPFEYL